MKTIGLIADTHDFFDPQLPACFSDCHEIWHLGDIGQQDILTQLNLIAPTRAVYGNIDPNELRWSLPENEEIELEGLRFLLTHIAGKPPRYTARVKKLLNDNAFDVLLCGHSHMQAVIKDKERNLVFINPGAAGRQGFHLFRTVMKIWVDNKKITNLEVLRLGRK
jgi:putative phosphoesterase